MQRVSDTMPRWTRESRSRRRHSCSARPRRRTRSTLSFAAQRRASSSPTGCRSGAGWQATALSWATGGTNTRSSRRYAKPACAPCARRSAPSGRRSLAGSPRSSRQTARWCCQQLDDSPVGREHARHRLVPLTPAVSPVPGRPQASRERGLGRRQAVRLAGGVKGALRDPHGRAAPRRRAGRRRAVPGVPRRPRVRRRHRHLGGRAQGDGGVEVRQAALQRRGLCLLRDASGAAERGGGAAADRIRAARAGRAADPVRRDARRGHPDQGRTVPRRDELPAARWRRQLAADGACSHGRLLAGGCAPRRFC
mmetsp:Transcript_25778/g.74565  ORF Transcript_25778/g.74565 Transcript_25778/m.74565 type:complete len:309 (+) Transcript_25778:214-1140(+)